MQFKRQLVLAISVLCVELVATPVQLEFFYREGCGECEKVKREVFPELELRYSGRYELTPRILDAAENYILLVQYQEAFGSNSNQPVFIVVNYDTILAGAAEIRRRLFNEIELAEANPKSRFEAGDGKGAELLAQRFRKFSWIGIAIAGLIDGINPCVFSALIFFISLLAAARMAGRKILAAGLVYCLACFLCYLGIGFGVFAFLQGISSFESVRVILELATVIVLLLFAVVTLVDAIRYRRSRRPERILLQLPDPLKKKAHSIMRRGLASRYLLPGVFLIGSLVTVIESVCTGQVYLPTLVFLTREHGMGLWIFYLLLYNLMFIAPLLIIFFFAWRGSSTMTFIHWSKRQVFYSKLAMSLFFLTMAILLWYL